MARFKQRPNERLSKSGKGIEVSFSFTYPNGQKTTRSKTFSRESSCIDRKNWMAQERSALIVAQNPDTNTRVIRRNADFSEESAYYLTLVQKKLETFSSRQRYIRYWCELFGTRKRSSITVAELQHIQQELLTNPKPKLQTGTGQGKKWTPEPRSYSWVNQAFIALQNMYTMLDKGKNLSNPVKEIEKVPEPPLEPKGLPQALIEKIFSYIPESSSKIRVRLLSELGIGHKQLMQIEEKDIDFEHNAVVLKPRKKGDAKNLGQRKPVTERGMMAFRKMVDMGYFGTYNPSGVIAVFKRACRKTQQVFLAKGIDLKKAPPEGCGVDLNEITPYWLRHSYGTNMYLATGDLELVKNMMSHSSTEMTKRYTLAAVPAVQEEALRKYEALTRRSALLQPLSTP
mgnify:CR=1 FL=1|jgi:integrase|tara:strand:- start:1042 stop:2238 length:1197 start_codon:yes stop_codon:yes gene_type:complete